MPLNKFESIQLPISTEETTEVLKRKSAVASFILKGEHPYYPVHTLIDTIPFGSNDDLYHISYYLKEHNVLIPYIFTPRSKALILQDVLFKIINLPRFPLQNTSYNYGDKYRRELARDEIIKSESPFATIAINAELDNLYFCQFSHHAGYSAFEALEQVQDNAQQQLAQDSCSAFPVLEWGEIVL